MNGKTRRGWLAVLAVVLAVATGVGGIGHVKLSSSAALSGTGSPSGETFVANRGRYTQPPLHDGQVASGETFVTNGYITCC